MKKYAAICLALLLILTGCNRSQGPSGGTDITESGGLSGSGDQSGSSGFTQDAADLFTARDYKNDYD
ncbi:MAG: hypothetical protein IJC68_02240, partial [Firmicutes bacterium]|nr:hypothetical protein [Bacillota bacterium]